MRLEATHGVSSKSQLELEETTCLKVVSGGENTIWLIAVLESGDTLVSRQEYSEGGYDFHSEIYRDSIAIDLVKEYL